MFKLHRRLFGRHMKILKKSASNDCEHISNVPVTTGATRQLYHSPAGLIPIPAAPGPLSPAAVATIALGGAKRSVRASGAAHDTTIIVPEGFKTLHNVDTLGI